MNVTKHANKRIRERCGINKKSCDRVAEKALTQGIPHGRTKGKLNKYITKLYFGGKAANNIRVYGEKVFIFHDDTLITVMQIPHEITKDMKNLIIPECPEKEKGL